MGSDCVILKIQHNSHSILSTSPSRENNILKVPRENTKKCANKCNKEHLCMIDLDGRKSIVNIEHLDTCYNTTVCVIPDAIFISDMQMEYDR